MINTSKTLPSRQQAADPDIEARRVVLQYLLRGFTVLTAATLLNTLTSFVVRHETYLLARIIGQGFIFVCMLGTLVLLRSRRYQRSISLLLVAVFFVSSAGVLYQWSIINPVGILLMSLTIVTAGILLGAKYSLYVMVAAAATLVEIQYAVAHDWVKPDIAWMLRPSTMTDVVSFTVIFAVIALVSWLFNRQMEYSLHRARRSEAGLQRQKHLLEIKVERRTRELQKAQMDKMQQVYRFAELGRLSTALFHDLANHSMALSLDIEGLQKRYQSDMLMRIQDNIKHIDGVVRRVRSQIQGKDNIERFNVIEQVQEVMQILEFTAKNANVKIVLGVQPSARPIMYTCDTIRFRQIVMNLLSNAIEAYKGDSPIHESAVVTVRIERTKDTVILSVQDFGVGIKRSLLPKIFDPFYTTKDKGIGIGLFIVQKVVEEDLNGLITVTSDAKNGTTFMVRLPLGSPRKI
jgi:signal transduction histidine kinase